MLPKRLILFDMIAEELGKLTHKGVDILELSVYRCKPDVGDLIDILELVHYQLTDVIGLDLSVQRVEQLLLDIGCGFFKYGNRYRALFASLDKSVEDLVAVEGLSSAVLFDNDKRQALDGLVSGKSLAAGKALSSSANAAGLICGSGIHNLALGIATERTSHNLFPLKILHI